MKVLFIGGTGIISTSSSQLAVAKNMDLYLLNRGTRQVSIPGAKVIRGDISKPAEIAKAIAGHQWDAVVNWIAFGPDDIERDIKLFAGSTRQYIFISSASVYQKPALQPVEDRVGNQAAVAPELFIPAHQLGDAEAAAGPGRMVGPGRPACGDGQGRTVWDHGVMSPYFARKGSVLGYAQSLVDRARGDSPAIRRSGRTL